jgi:RNA polymerase sigma factor (sigma-70 family)
MQDGERPLSAMDFTPWYVAEHPKVLAALSAVSGDPEMAREATDEAFCRCYARWHRVRAMQSPAGWTYRVALNSLRRARRRRSLERFLLTRRTPSVVEFGPGYTEIRDLLSKLTTRQRTVMALRFVADLPEAEIAEILKLKRGTVASTIAAARRRLSVLIEDSPGLEASTDA